MHYYASTDVNRANGGNKYNAYRMINRGCTGVEKKLIERPRYLQVNKNTCNSKVTVKCNSEFDCYKILAFFLIVSFCTLAAAGTRQSCLNGELTKGNTDINTLYLCVSGVWKKLCSSLWGTQQKAVACRQLAQGPLNQLQTTVSGSYHCSYMYTWNATYSNLVNGAGFFIYNIQCTGKEKALTECRFTKVDTSFCNNIPVNLICEQGYKIYIIIMYALNIMLV